MSGPDNGYIRIPKWMWAAIGSAAIVVSSFGIGAVSWAARVEQVLSEASTRIGYIAKAVDQLVDDQRYTSLELARIRADLAINSGRIAVLEDRSRRAP